MRFAVTCNGYYGVSNHEETMEVFGGVLERYNPREIMVKCDDDVWCSMSLIDIVSLEEFVHIGKLVATGICLEGDRAYLESGEEIPVLRIENDFGYELDIDD